MGTGGGGVEADKAVVVVVVVAGGNLCVDTGNRGVEVRGGKGLARGGRGRGLVGAAGRGLGSGSRTPSFSFPSFPSVCSRLTSSGLANETVVSADAAGIDILGVDVDGWADCDCGTER